MDKNIYLLLAIFVTVVDMATAALVFRSGRKKAIYLGVDLLLAGLAEISYTVSIFMENYFAMKLALAVFFSCITLLLMFLLTHFMHYTHTGSLKAHRTIMGFGWLLVCADIVLEFINPFVEIVMHFEYHSEYSVPWVFVPRLLYNLHLILCYILFAVIFGYLIHRILHTARVYRGKYYTMLLALIIAVSLNAVCLILQSQGMPDYSQLAYSVVGLILYWDVFHNTQRPLRNSMRSVVLNEIGHPVILFGEDDLVADRNYPAEFLLPHWKRGTEYGLGEFLTHWGLAENLPDLSENTSFLWTYRTEKRQTHYRVDYRVIKDGRGRIIGRILIFTDTSQSIDLLTGFLSKNAFDRYIQDADLASSYPVAVAICDINRLSHINHNYGKDVGDQCIQTLAKTLRKHCPDDSWFVRSNDANLLVAAPHTALQDMRGYISRVKEECLTNGPRDILLGIQSAISVADEAQPSIQAAIDAAMFSMRSRKLMDQSSAHSSLLDSLAQALTETDETTEAHVARTKAMGEQLALRLNFSDLQISDLSLLCLLHDIGKLGIPLEILNKPTKLDANEWAVMKTHAEKGYRIAMASSELSRIADYIRYHHESWDGGGYPDGLKQECIPLLSRVIAIIDAYDAMTNDRPYHKAISDAAARAELKRCAGTQFDPYLVSEFLQMLQELYPLKEEDMLSAPAGSYSGPIPVPVVHEENSGVRSVAVTEYTLDENDIIISVDDQFTALTGYTKEDLERYPLSQRNLIPAEDQEYYMQEVGKQLKQTGTARLEHRIRRKDGTTRFVLCYGSKRFDPYLKKEVSLLTVTDSENLLAVQNMQRLERGNAERHIEALGKVLKLDPLTGILNHEAFVHAVEMELLQEKKLIFMVMDVDYFKQYNDTYGHLEGDRMLIRTAGILDQQVAGKGFAGRLGGDEFAAVLSVDSHSPVEVHRHVEAVFNALIEHMQVSNHAATVSLGAVLIGDEIKTFTSAYRTADRALYQAKDNGRSTFFISN